MNRDGKVEDDAADRLGGKINGFDLTEDDAGNCAAAKGNEDDLARGEFLVGLIRQNATAFAEDFGRYYLEKHGYIIA